MKKKVSKFRSLVPVLCVLALVLTACGKNPSGDADNGTYGTPAVTGTEVTDPTGEPGGAEPTGTEPGKNDPDKQNPGRPSVTKAPAKVTPAPSTESISSLAAEQNKKPELVNGYREVELKFKDDGTYKFQQVNCFYNENVKLTVTAPEGAKVYYTLDGTEPTVYSAYYVEPLVFEKRGGNFPEAYVFRAAIIDEDRNMSQVAARTFLVGSNLDSRFSTTVIFISGDPDELYNGPNGIMYKNNAFERGRESERMVYIEAFKADGTPIFAQFGGVRVYGGYSRNYDIKSFKLYSRKSYDEEHKNFKFSEFNTPKLYELEEGENPIITKYDKLVLRNGGNDYQFAFIRDEISQRLCKRAGFLTYEEVIPCVCYLNGEYYSLFWLHENYCDKYFKEKFGDAEGEFIVAEGTDQEKSDDEDIQDFVDDYNRKYATFSTSDLTNDATYKKLCDFMDVESYLDFFAWNIALNNWDWPNNNFKCFKYVPAEGESAGTGVYDGRWRFLPHDMDYTYGIYDQAKANESYNTLKVILDEDDERYSPLFTKLMERKDCRAYFRAKTMEYINGAQSEQAIKEEYEKLHEERKTEFSYFYEHLQNLNRKGNWNIWAQPQNYAAYERQIYTFAEKRAGYVVRYMDDLLPELE